VLIVTFNNFSAISLHIRLIKGGKPGHI